MVINTDHERSISREYATPQPRLRWHASAVWALLVLAGWATPAFGAAPSCASALGTPVAAEVSLRTVGRKPSTAVVSVLAGHTYLIQVEEHGNDALIEVLDLASRIVARADHPERRSGTRRALVTATAAPSLSVRVTGKEHEGVRGTAIVQVFDLAVLRTRTDCLAVLRMLAAADSDYASGQAMSRSRASPGTSNPRASLLRAAQEYASAEVAIDGTSDPRLRGETALAVAGVEYFDLQEWAAAADHARAAAEALRPLDPYRHARAEAIQAASWLEMGSAAPAAPYLGEGAERSALLTRARLLLRQLVQFHLQRGERYDAGLQLTNVGLTYLNEGSYLRCESTLAASGRLFASLGEIPRRAQAWQNRALCLWGLGQLPEALPWFERALKDVHADSHPSLYIGVLTNTALAHYALGHADESLHLYDEALAFARRVQSPRDEAYCLYGIGVNYYALGDRERARAFLERSLAIRTVALDGRGRMASLRALATIDAEQGRLEQALALDQEALGLAVAPSAIARIRIQQAGHTAAVGQPAAAQSLLDEVIAGAAKAGPLIHAEALLQRAQLRRSMGRPRDALADLAAARPRLHEFGSVMEEFEADLELARALRQAGQPQAALAAVERALSQSDAVRLQTANPELRAQLLTPLRPAYDLKLELLRDRYEQALAAGRERDANTIAAVAFASADASRAHSFADVAAQRYSRGMQQALAGDFRRREELYRELAARRFALDSRLERSGNDDPRVRHLVADIAELRRQVDTLNTTIARISTQPGASSAAHQPPTPVPTLAPGTALLSYWLGAGSAYAWVVVPGEVHWVRLSSADVITQEAVAFHRSLTRLVDVPVERRLEDGLALYRMLIGPLETWLSPVRRWLIVPDGALDYVPFAALRARSTVLDSYVVMQHEVAVTPAAWMLDLRQGRSSVADGGRILLVADPVYEADDPRVTAVNATSAVPPQPAAAAPDAKPPEYSRLRFTADEATGIAALFPPAEVDALTGLDATRERLLARDWSQYRFIHIATHGVVDAQVPGLSSLILGSYDRRGQVADRAVRVADISLQTLTAQVAVLSACETALGTAVRSEGLVGMGSTLLARGARAVVASLWPVPDEASARLMTEFYQHMLRDSMPPEAALAAAMRSTAARPASADPALWAAFQVSVRGARQSAHGIATTDSRAQARPQKASPVLLGGDRRERARYGVAPAVDGPSR